MLQSYPSVQTSPRSLSHHCTSQGHCVLWPAAAENHCYKAVTPAVPEKTLSSLPLLLIFFGRG